MKENPQRDVIAPNGASMLSRAEIDLGAVAHNVMELRRAASPAARVMAAVKANGYGHGAVQIAKTALASGAEELGVANVDEAVLLRKNGINAPILIFGYTDAERVGTLAAYDLSQTVFSLDAAGRLSRAASVLGKKIKIHIKLDTGMGRVGILFAPDLYAEPDHQIDAVVRDVRGIFGLPGCSVDGIFTHFATADHWDKSFAGRQFHRFMDIIDRLRQEGFVPPVLHAANSAATIEMPETHLDMVRPGISVYGLYPSGEVCRDGVSLRPALSLKTRVVHIKSVPAGFPVSYGRTYKTERQTVIATVPVGYADGFPRLLSSVGHMLVNGQSAPVAGRVCMDMTMLDVGHIPDVSVGDEVVVIGNQGRETVSADEIASIAGTISYEVVASIGMRVKRIYKTTT